MSLGITITLNMWSKRLFICVEISLALQLKAVFETISYFSVYTKLAGSGDIVFWNSLDLRKQTSMPLLKTGSETVQERVGMVGLYREVTVANGPFLETR